jgi:hypothetical protein
VRDAGRQVKNIACTSHMAFVTFELVQENKIIAGSRVLSKFLCRQSPLAHPDTLAQENVVIITMGTDAAARGGKADHQVIDTPIWDEWHQVENISKCWKVFLDVMNEQGPVALWQRLKESSIERSGVDAITGLFFTTDGKHYARFNIVKGRKPREFVSRNSGTHDPDRLRHEQLLFLPVTGKKLLRCELTGKL